MILLSMAPPDMSEHPSLLTRGKVLSGSGAVLWEKLLASAAFAASLSSVSGALSWTPSETTAAPPLLLLPCGTAAASAPRRSSLSSLLTCRGFANPRNGGGLSENSCR